MRKISQIFTHGLYNKTTYDYDYALFELKDPVEITDRVEPVCLPDQDDAKLVREINLIVKDFRHVQIPSNMELLQVELHDRELHVAGWGKLKTSGKQSQVLQVVKVRSMTNDLCIKNYYKGKDFNLYLYL